MEGVWTQSKIKGQKVDRLSKLKKWWLVLKRTKEEAEHDNLGIVSAGVAFYVFLGVFPLLAAFISLYGVVASPGDIAETINSFSSVLPADIVRIADGQMQRLANSSSVASQAALISFALALWTGSKAVKGMMQALTVVNGKKDSRNILVKTSVALGLTLGGICLSGIIVALLAIIPVVGAYFNLGGLVSAFMHIGRWALLGVAVAVSLGILYRFAPDRRGQKIKLFTPGAIISTIVWLLASGLFSWFVSNFGNYNKTYGSLGAIVVLLLWLSLSAFVFIIGAELDHEINRIERQPLS